MDVKPRRGRELDFITASRCSALENEKRDHFIIIQSQSSQGESSWIDFLFIFILMMMMIIIIIITIATITSTGCTATGSFSRALDSGGADPAVHEARY